MRVQRLDLLAYGPFSNARLDFSAKPNALQLVYGPNEAGKSTTLRALLALLYGIPARTGDAHRHEMSRLRIGAVLADARGQQVQVVRRKGLKQTLLDKDGQPLAESIVSDLLGGIDETLFRNMFGLDHDRLREGAEALLKGGGQLGEGLFDASVGARALREVKESLRLEAEELYKARGKNSRLNVALEALREKALRKKAQALSPTTYVEQTQVLTQKRAQRDDALERRRGLLAEQVRLTRALQLLPLLARRESLDSELSQLSAPANVARGSMGSDLLEEQIRDLERRYGVQLSAESDLPQQRNELAGLQRELAAVALRIGETTLPTRPIDTPLRTRLRKLSSEHTRAVERVASLVETASALQAERNALHERLTTQVSDGSSELVEALLDTVEREDLVASLAREEQELARRSTALGRALGQLDSALAIDQLAGLDLPEERALLELEKGEDTLRSEQSQVEARLVAVADRVRDLSLARNALLAGGELISQQQLDAARADRDRDFELLSRALLDGSGTRVAGPQVGQYRAEVERADQLSDRMRIEVVRAAELNRVQGELTLLADESSALRDRLPAIAQRAEVLRERLRTLLAPTGLALAAARELRPRLLKLQALREQAAHLLADQAAHTTRSVRGSQRAAELRDALAPELAVPATLALAQAVSLARGFLQRRQEQARERAQLREKAHELSLRETQLARQRNDSERERDLLATRFRDELARAGLDGALSPDELLACLDDMSLSLELNRKIEQLHARMQALQLGAEALAQDVRQRVAEHVPEAQSLSLAEQLEALGRTQRRDRESQRDHTRVKLELQQLNDELTRLGDGESPLALKQRLAGSDPSQSRARLLELESALAALDDELGGLDQEIGRLDAGLATLTSSPFAVGIAEELEGDLADVRGLLRRYLEVRLSQSILSREVERFRAAHQAPLLARASALFARLTLRNYEALEAELDDHDEPVLCAVHKSQKRVRIAGLSDGTRDQLYLSLRVASLEQYVASGRALPLVLDDALVHFDDKRAEAALVVLGELASRTQVLFFTHHARMIDLAKRALKSAQVALHELDPARGTVSFRDDGPLFAHL